MAIPTSIEARLYYRCAFQRYDDAQILLRAAHTTGAVYLAGYGVECVLKALILAHLAPVTRTKLLEAFRGTRAHDYGWLRTQYLEAGGPRPPRTIALDFSLVNDWSTDLRYLPRTLSTEDAEGFLAATGRILRWADERL